MQRRFGGEGQVALIASPDGSRWSRRGRFGVVDTPSGDQMAVDGGPQPSTSSGCANPPLSPDAIPSGPAGAPILSFYHLMPLSR